MEATIISLRCGVYTILKANNETIECKPRGLFRHQGITPVVGDKVIIENNVIVSICPRKNYLIRPRIANIDELAIVMSLIEPEFSALLLDKFISYANYFKLPANVIISKCDKDSQDKIEEKMNALNRIGIKTIYFSNVDKRGLNEVKELLSHKTIALMGQTGVGKSSLLNAIIPNSNREIGEYSNALGRGKHQTKEVVLIPSSSGFIADTPGFSSLELPFYKEDLAQCFPGFDKYFLKCKYHNCLHHNETECAVKEALTKNLLSKESYENYLKLLEELKSRKDRY